MIITVARPHTKFGGRALYTIHENNNEKILTGNIICKENIKPAAISFNTYKSAEHFAFLVESYLYKNNKDMPSVINDLFHDQKFDKCNISKDRELPEYLFQTDDEYTYNINKILNITYVPPNIELSRTYIEKHDSYALQNMITNNNMNLLICRSLDSFESDNLLDIYTPIAYNAIVVKLANNPKHYQELFNKNYL